MFLKFKPTPHEILDGIFMHVHHQTPLPPLDAMDLAVPPLDAMDLAVDNYEKRRVHVHVHPNVGANVADVRAPFPAQVEPL